MFGLIFIAAAVIQAISSKDLMDFDRNIGFQQGLIKSDKENLVSECDMKDEVAALKEMVLRQGQEISGLKQQQNIQKQEIAGLKQENFLLNKKISEQDEMIGSQIKLINKLENVGKNQDKKIEDMQYVIAGQSKEITNLKQTAKNQCEIIKTLKMEHNSPNLKENDDPKADNGLKNLAETNNVTSQSEVDANSKTKAQNSLTTTFARKSRIATSANIAFSAYLDHSLDHLTTGHIVKCNQALLNVGNAYNTITGLFTVPQSGAYLLTFTINSNSNNDSGYKPTYVKLVSNNRNILDAETVLYDKHREHMGGNTAIIQLTAGESVWLEVFGTTNGQLQSDGNYRYVSFSGVLLF